LLAAFDQFDNAVVSQQKQPAVGLHVRDAQKVTRGSTDEEEGILPGGLLEFAAEGDQQLQALDVFVSVGHLAKYNPD